MFDVNIPSANICEQRVDKKSSFCSQSAPGFPRSRENRTAHRSMPAEERVLCFPRELLEELGVFQGLSLDIEKYLPVVTSPIASLFESQRGRAGPAV
jgi:hypothetical protein